MFDVYFGQFEAPILKNPDGQAARLYVNFLLESRADDLTIWSSKDVEGKT